MRWYWVCFANATGWRRSASSAARTTRADAAATPAQARDFRAEAAELLDLRLGDAKNARALYEQVLESDPAHPRAQPLLLKLYEKTGDFKALVELLANRRFPAGNFIRSKDQLDYIQEPDVFHDLFGHVPILADPTFGDYMEEYGRGGLKAARLGQVNKLARLYWYTVEFGLIEEPQGLRIYGAGILSSPTESVFALDSDSPNRIGFDLARVMRTDYRIDDFQQNYFVIDSLDQLLDTTVNTDFAPLYAQNAALPPIPIADILPGDAVVTHGTQEYALAKSG